MMNHIGDIDNSKWTKDDYKYLGIITWIQTPQYLKKLYETHKDNTLICWKGDLRKVINLPDKVNRGLQ